MKTIYIPGLGGKRSLFFQRAAVEATNLFRKSDNKIRFFNPRWYTPEPYQEKYQRLIDFNAAMSEPRRVWAISAGASLAVRLCSETPIDQVHLVCGKVSGSSSIGEHHRNRAPAFVESVQYSEELAGSFDTDTICYIPKDNADGVVESADMLVEGAHVQELPPIRHAKAIGYAILRYLHTV